RLRLARLHVLNDTPEPTVRDLLRLFAWASVDSGSKSIQALRSAVGDAQAGVELLDQLPFKSQNRYSAVRVRNRDSEHVLVLGAPEALEPYLTSWGRKPPDDMPYQGAYAPRSPQEQWLHTGRRLLLFAEAGAARPASVH